MKGKSSFVLHTYFTFPTPSNSFAESCVRARAQFSCLNIYLFAHGFGFGSALWKRVSYIGWASLYSLVGGCCCCCCLIQANPSGYFVFGSAKEKGEKRLNGSNFFFSSTRSFGRTREEGEGKWKYVKIRMAIKSATSSLAWRYCSSCSSRSTGFAYILCLFCGHSRPNPPSLHRYYFFSSQPQKTLSTDCYSFNCNVREKNLGF